MLSLRTLTRRWMPLGIKRSFQRVLLGYDSYAPSFSSAGEDMILRHLLGSDWMKGFYVDVEGRDFEVLESNDWKRFRPRFIVVEDEGLNPHESQIVKMLRGHGYELCAQNVIILDKINEYFLIDRRNG